MKHFRVEKPLNLNYRLEYGKTTYNKWTTDEFRDAWHRNPLGQGQKEAKERKHHCVIVHTGKESDALVLSALFVRLIFAMPSCTHWDGSTLSLHYGQVGHYTTESSRVTAEKMVEAWHWGLIPDVYGSLFADNEEPVELGGFQE